MITTSPSWRLPDTTSTAEPSLRPTTIRRGCGFLSEPMTQTIRVWPGNTGAVDGVIGFWSWPPAACCCRRCRPPWPDWALLPSRFWLFVVCGRYRSAEFGTFSTLLRSSILIVRFAVMPGFNFCSGLSTSKTTL